MSSFSAEEVVRLLQGEMAEVLSFAAAQSRRMGLGTAELAAVEHLHASPGGLTPTQLGRRLSMSSGTVTGLVDRLERGGYAERRPNPADRRSSVVVLRSSGIEEAARHMRPLAADLLEATARLSAEDRAAVGAYLQAVTDILVRHTRGRE